MLAVLLLGANAFAPLTTSAINPVLTPVANPDNFTAPASGTLTVAAPGVLANDYGDSLQAGQVGGPTHGTLSLHADGSFTYTPSNGFTGTDTFTYHVANGTNTSNTATVTITVPILSADLQVGVTVDNATPNLNDTLTFTVTVTNNGPPSVGNVQVKDQLPSGLSYVSSTPSQTTTYDQNTGIWTVGNLANQASATLILKAKFNTNATSVTNSASITSSSLPDPVTSNNTASIAITQKMADLFVQMTIDKQAPNNGDGVTYTVTLTNNGPDAATTVQLTDYLPTGVSVPPVTGHSQGTTVSYNPADQVNQTPPTVTLSVTGSLASQASVTLTITTTVTDKNNITNQASVSHSDQTDPNTNNNFAFVGGNPNSADLILFNTVDNASANPGDPIVFTVTVHNSGPLDVTSAQVTEQLPTGVTYVSSSASQGTPTYNAGNPGNGINPSVTWPVGSLVSQANATMTIHATMPQNQAFVNASITTSSPTDPNSNNNSAQVTLTPPGADLMVNNTVDKATPKFGETVTFTVTLTNNGPNNATNVRVFDTIPFGFTVSSKTASQGAYDSNTGTWTVGSLASQAQATLRLVGQIATANPIQDQSSVSGDQYDPNNTNNNSTVTTTPIQPQLSNVAIRQSAVCFNSGMKYTESTSLSITNGPATVHLNVTLAPSGGDANIPNSVTGSNFVTDASGAGNYSHDTVIQTNSAVATYPTSVFVTITTDANDTVASGSATLTNDTAPSPCQQPVSVDATASQSAFCNSDAGLFQYVDGVHNLVFTGGLASTTYTVQIAYTGGRASDFTNPRNVGSFTTDAGGRGTFDNQIVFNGTSPSQYPSAITVNIIRNSTVVASVVTNAGNGKLTTGPNSFC